ncbi:MAG: aminopeptidase P family protein [Anaerolineales bacterium]|nr:aminopeptidase P family protein [Anaerolineales bacterium]
MLRDIDRYMATNNLDAILVTGPATHNPPMFYLTGGAHLTNADLVKIRGGDPILFHTPMERDEAAKTGLATKNISDYRLNDLLEQSGGDYTKAVVLRYHKMLEDLNLTKGRMSVYGKIDAGFAFAIFSGLQERLPDLEIIGEINDSTLLQAMATKDESQVERIRKMGMITTQVVGLVAEFLCSHRTKESVLVKSNDQPLKVSDVKSRINLWLAERGAENPEGTIFAIGRDAGVPHSSGNPDDIIRQGQTIVFDIFPCEAGGGYYYDFTRTWCLGYAPDHVYEIYEDVLVVYQQIMNELKAHSPCQPYQERTCELFEAQGHATIKSTPETQEGYVHSLGHGLGLYVHERPWFGKNATDKDRLEPGVVVTIEPGLYYPDRELGVRLENTVWVRPDGQMEVLADFPMDLVLPLKGN